VVAAVAQADMFYEPTYRDVEWYEDADRVHDWVIDRQPLGKEPVLLDGWGRPPASWTISAKGDGYRYELFIPNEYRKDWTKQIWVQIIVTGESGGIAGPEQADLRIADPADRCTWKLISSAMETHGATERRITQRFDITDQPNQETLIWETVLGWRIERAAVVIRCVPEPATLGLLSLGAVIVLRRRP